MRFQSGLASRILGAEDDADRQQVFDTTTAIDTAEAVAVLLEKYEICCDMLHGFDWSPWHSNDPCCGLQKTGLQKVKNFHSEDFSDGW